MSNMKDALGQELKIGQTYGYSSGSSSRITVVVGTLISIGGKRVTLDVTNRENYLYGDKLDPQQFAGITSVSSCRLFPVKDQ